MVGRVGYAPTTPAMSMQHSTIELKSQYIIKLINLFFYIPINTVNIISINYEIFQ